jgi:hypothetical protein
MTARVGLYRFMVVAAVVAIGAGAVEVAPVWLQRWACCPGLTAL